MEPRQIFTDTRQLVRFAFALAAYPTGAAAVQLALADLRLPAVMPDAALRAHAATTLATLRAATMRAEGASLIAAFTHDSTERERAIGTLHPLFCNLLARLIDNRALVRKLVQRHYTPICERSAAWELHALANEYGCGHERTRRAAQALDHCARNVERLALTHLAAQLLPKVEREVCHA